MPIGEKIKLSDEERARVNAALLGTTVPKLAKAWNISDAVLLRAIAGYNIQRGTRALILIGLGEESK